MIYNSWIFLILFLPLTLAGWYGLHAAGKSRAARVFMIGMSLWFYGSFQWKAVIVLLISLDAGYCFSAAMERAEGTARTVIMAAGVVFNLLLLGIFKYPGASALTGVSLAMPVGLSFYTFSQISYIVDRAGGEIPHAGLLDYAVYVTWFPKLAEGPITRYEEFRRQIKGAGAGRINKENMLRGFILLVFGMAKKMLLADVLAPAVSFGYQNAYYLDTLSVILTVSAYAMQLYFDFSGFCDMTLGISRMLGVDLPLNFNAPYHSTSFSSFWQRWHMSLTSFFTKYVYIPLGGSRKGSFRTCLNVMIVFFLSGLWHGNGMTYILWGVLTGALVLVSRQLRKGKAAGKEGSAGADAAPAAGWKTALLRLRTFYIFCFTLIFFGAVRTDYAFAMVRRLFVPMWPGFLYRIAQTVELPETYVLFKAVSLLKPEFTNPLRLALLVLILIVSAVLVNGSCAQVKAKNMKLSGRNAVLAGILLVWCLVSMTGVSTYLYFAF